MIASLGLVVMTWAITLGHRALFMRTFDDEAKSPLSTAPSSALLSVSWVVSIALLFIPVATGSDSRPDPSSGVSVRAGEHLLASGAIRLQGHGRSFVVGRIQDARVIESSDLAASRRRPGRYWTINDSGDSASLYCLSARGDSCGTWRVTGAAAVDWEAMASAKLGGNPTLVIGDIGDNEGSRRNISVYFVREPRRGAEVQPSVRWTSPVRRVELTYPGGPRDAEALFIDARSHDLYVIEKALGAVAGVYRAGFPYGQTQVMQLVGSISVPGLLPAVTSADLSADGTRLVIGTYSEVFEYTRSAGEPLEALWAASPSRIRSLPLPQREAVAYSKSGKAIVSTSEGRNSKLVKSVR
jgi:hypothetical protein